MNMRQANIAKTRIFKQGYKVKSMNSRYGADYHKRIANSRTLGQRFVNKYAKAFSTPHTTYAGRTTTIGKEFTENILTLGVVPTVKDLNYLHKHKGEFGKVK